MQILIVTIEHVKVGVEKTCFPTILQIYKIKLTLNQPRCEMKSYDELKAEMEAIQ